MIVEDIINNPYGKGNDTLYDLCSGDFKLHKLQNNDESKDTLAAQLWLIGRAYAASPERRNYNLKQIIRSKIRNNNISDKRLDKIVELQSSGDGLDTFFDNLAKRLLKKYNSNSGFELDKNVSNNQPYNYDSQNINSGNQSDIKKLKKSITCVLDFNLFIRDCIFEIDKEYFKKIPQLPELQGLEITIDEKDLKDLKNNQNNILSFCSKFLHFHYPNTVFIMDSITKSHFKRKDTKYKFTFSGIEENFEIDDMYSDVNTFVSTFINDRYSSVEEKEKNKKQIDIEKEYIRHCAREYILATYIYNKDDFGDRYVPRIIDTFMLKANSNT